MGDATRQFAQRIHFLNLQELTFGPHPLGHFFGQQGVGVIKLFSMLTLAQAVLGHILDKGQAVPRRSIGRHLPLGLAHCALDQDAQVCAPALAAAQAAAQVFDHLVLVGFQTPREA